MQNKYSNQGSALHWLVIIICAASLTAVAVQWRTIWKLRNENKTLRASQNPPALAGPAVERAEPMAEETSSAKRELLRLRSEVQQLRQQVAATRAPAPEMPQTAASVAAPPPVTAPATHVPREDIRQLGQAASRGDSMAMEKMAAVVASALKQTDDQSGVMGEVKAVFDQLGTEAGQNDETALDALSKATRMQYLQGFAIGALGQAAGMGNEKALDLLLDPERNSLSRSQTMAALRPAADAGNARAIDALVAAANDPKKSRMWATAVRGLEKPAVRGNAAAIDALALIARSEPAATRRTAVRALEKAAANNNPKAAEALKGVGPR